MNKVIHNFRLNRVYRFFKVSKQAVHKHGVGMVSKGLIETRVLEDARMVRREHPKMGARKIYLKVQPNYIGRDGFEKILLGNGERVKIARNYAKTTRRGKVVFSDLVSGKKFHRGNQVWVSDITYYLVGNRFYYLNFVMDLVSRKILGYAVGDTLEAKWNVAALKMAFRNSQNARGVILHSDRGSQYSSKAYTDILAEHSCHSSMGNKAVENPFAERINGTIKNEYLVCHDIKTFDQLRKKVTTTVTLYNDDRPHRSLVGYATPSEIYEASTLGAADPAHTVVVHDYRIGPVAQGTTG